MSMSLDLKQQGVNGCPRSSYQVWRSVALTPLLVLAVWFMWQKGCVPKEDVLPTAAWTAHAAGPELVRPDAIQGLMGKAQGTTADDGAMDVGHTERSESVAVIEGRIQPE